MKIAKYLTIAVFCFVLSACFKSEEKVNVKKATLYYAASANNLQSYIWTNVQDINRYYSANSEKDLYVFFKNLGEDANLYRVTRTSSGNTLNVVKTYDKALGSGDVKFLEQLLQDLTALPEVSELTDIIFSSHGSSWLPTIFQPLPLLSQETPPIKSRSATDFSFGQDEGVNRNQTMYIEDMAMVLEKYSLNSIIFDACNMCSIEVLYQLRNSAKYILSSPAEVVAAGMNYPVITKYFTQDITLESLRIMAEETYKFFDAKENVFEKSATFTVTDCSNLEEFGSVVKDLVARYGTPENNIIATPSLRYDGSNGIGKDYRQYLYNLIEKFGVEGDKVALDAIWTKTFPYYYHTEKIFGWPMEGSCGVAGYIYRDNINPTFNEYYMTLDWGKLVRP